MLEMYYESTEDQALYTSSGSSGVRAVDCRSTGPSFKSGSELVLFASLSHSPIRFNSVCTPVRHRLAACRRRSVGLADTTGTNSGAEPQKTALSNHMCRVHHHRRQRTQTAQSVYNTGTLFHSYICISRRVGSVGPAPLCSSNTTIPRVQIVAAASSNVG
ncbi:hypothetical protein BDD12DRAFT_397351 [Trichophaea hybrida]|nr:hypothetical protein BDD12DRAFT_397351 [Trichophaea hybrida]